MAVGEFVYRRRVQYKETDASGIVHFSTFFLFAEEAEHAMWRELGLSVEPRETEIGWPRVAASFDFLRALRFEDEIEVRLSAEVEERTVLIEKGLITDDELKAKMEEVRARFDVPDESESPDKKGAQR